MRATHEQLDSGTKALQATAREQEAESRKIVASEKELARAQAAQAHLDKQIRADSKKLEERLESIVGPGRGVTAKGAKTSSLETGLSREGREVKGRHCDSARGASGL